VAPGRAALRWKNQLAETVLQGSYVQSTNVDNPSSVSRGAELGLLFGITPLLSNYRIGGRQGFLLRGAQSNRWFLGPLYSELTGGFRLGPVEAHTFVGVSWLNLGGGPDGFLLGGISPRAGVAVGARLGALELHALVATEYTVTFVGGPSERTHLFGLQFSFLKQNR